MSYEEILKRIRDLASTRVNGVSDPHEEIRRLQVLLASVEKLAAETTAPHAPQVK